MHTLRSARREQETDIWLHRLCPELTVRLIYEYPLTKGMTTCSGRQNVIPIMGTSFKLPMPILKVL